MKPKILNDMINIAELLKDCPKGTKLYSPLFGEVEFDRVEHCVYVNLKDGYNYCFSEHGKPFNYSNSECLIFPSKDHRTWEDWKAPKPHYDIANFKPFDKVLVRYDSTENWKCGLFSHISTSKEYKFVCVGATYCQCIPFNNDTKHLLGTADMCPEEYINW